ncbi:flagellar biosynthetic protein FliR [Solimicrobium silvestre]|uniref:Flagellar biosynthetic protein FliR n=1 Tax=Solimicrobium silvestre TaxID=2099400 RepID=A0A2S9H1P6_9BURK|nr:flagellar biosynthetic protein FliR [Solimicrobium silvestre]PRC93899.1 fliR: flagellar biosynthetic protein FliR [Solimicrobium silvestre]
MPLEIDVGMAWITSVLLCSLRLSAMLMMTPILDGFGIPARIRIFLVIALSAALVSALPHNSAAETFAAGPFFASAASELFTGALLGFGAMCAFAAFSFAGNLLDQQLGFGLANVFDPMTRAQSPLIASLFGLMAVVMFFTVDAHHALLRGFAYSLEKVPLGSAMHIVSPGLLVHQFGLIFSFGLLLAAPVLFCVYLIEIGMAVISRNLPQMNIFMISIPVKIICGLILLSILMTRLAPLFNKIFGSIFSFWEGVL